MTEKDLRKLNRYQLLELLLVQTKRVEELQARLEEAEKQLNEQDLKMSSMGSIAEASLQLGGFFKAAEASAEIYLNAAKERAREIEAAAAEKAELIIANTMETAKALNVI
jgi:hypothetical protein